METMTEKQKQIIAQRNAKLKYEGKSKDVYELSNGNVLLVFGDSFTGTNGKEDPGGNTNIGTKAGLGRKNLEVSSFLFDQIANTLGVPTQNVNVDLENNILEARRVTTLGKGWKFTQDGKTHTSEGLEFISRNLAWGSFLKRYKEVKQGDCVRDEHGMPFVEVSTKNDAANDPFFSRNEFIKNGIAAADFDKGVEYTKRITKFLTELFAAAGMDLIDMKMEFGKTEDGELILSDEISPGSLRAQSLGKGLSKDEIHSKLMEYKKKIKSANNKTGNPQVLIVMGSDNDLPTVAPAAKMLEKFGIAYEIDFSSAHRVPEKAAKLSKEAADRGIKVIIAAAGLAAHLPGVLASLTTLPVIGIPLTSSTGDGLDALYSIVQMPAGIPVATVGINRAENAGILAAKIIGTFDPAVRKKLEEYKKEMSDTVHEKSNALKELGYEKYIKEKLKK